MFLLYTVALKEVYYAISIMGKSQHCWKRKADKCYTLFLRPKLTMVSKMTYYNKEQLLPLNVTFMQSIMQLLIKH